MSASRSNPEVQRAVADGLVVELYRRSRVTVAFILAFAVLLHGVLGSAYSHGTGVRLALNSALVLMFVRLAAVLGLSRLKDLRIRYWVFTSLTASIGVSFGVLNALAYPRISSVQVALLTSCQAAVASVALVSMAASMTTFLLYMLPNLGTLAVLAALRPRPELGEGFALMLALYALVLVLLDWYVHSNLKRGLILSRELTEMTLLDPLTGLRNRRYVTEFMELEASLAVRTGQASLRSDSKTVPYRFEVILLDIDHFKAVNDTYGHETGDAVLVKVGQILLGAVRDPDIAARWGGEEFVVIARNVEKGAIGLSERIRRAVAEARIDVGSGPALRITCSIGHTGFPFFEEEPGALTWQDVLALADRSLYFAKNHGRNRSVGVAPGGLFGDIPTFASLLKTDLDDAENRGWVRFLPEERLHEAIALVS